MNFTKSINGYNPKDVEVYEAQINAKFESKKREAFLAIENVNKEYQTLQEQKKSLLSNLQSVRDSTLFFSNYEKHFSSTIDGVGMDTLGKIQEIIIDQETFIEKVAGEISNIDEYLLLLRQELAKTCQNIDQVINGITICSKIDDQLNQIDNMIKSFDTGNLDRGSFNAEDLKCSIPQSPKLVPVEKPTGPRLVLPRTEVEPINNVIQTKQISEASRKRPKTVLIAENDPDTSATLTAVMEREGYKVSLAADAYAIVNMTKEFEPFGVIILDSLLPYIETNALIKQIRNSEKWNDVPILATTSEQNKANSISLLESGANDFIEKPFNPRELAARVNRLNQSLTQPSMKKGV